MHLLVMTYATVDVKKIMKKKLQDIKSPSTYKWVTISLKPGKLGLGEPEEGHGFEPIKLPECIFGALSSIKTCFHILKEL